MQRYLKECKYSYNEDDLLGEGSFGKVFKGFNTHSQQDVALKQIELAKLEKGEDMLKTILLSEISVMKKFNRKMREDPCPFLVRQEDVFRTDKHIYIAMEICMGGTLEDQIRGKRFKEKEAVEVLYCIGKGLEYMGHMGIAHRDLKPENIFISSVKLGQGEGKETKIYKIGDFGFAAQRQDFDIAMGTVPYMAPQMFKKQKYTGKVDIWSLGIIAYQIMFGGLYFIGKNVLDFKKNILEKPFILSQKEKAKVSSNYQDFLAQCLNKDPKTRLPVDQLLNHPLFFEIHKELANLQATVFQSEKTIEMKKMASEDSRADDEKIFQEIQAKAVKNLGQVPAVQANQKSQQQVKKQQEPPNVPLVAFSKAFYLLDQCSKMRIMAQKFHNFQQKTGRCTEFIQLYLLKDSYAMLNRLTYTVLHKQNHIQLDPQEFQTLLSPENEPLFTQLYNRCLKECTWVTGLFNEKYKWFASHYIGKFEEEDQDLIRKVVNQEPYQYVNGQVFEKELRKWLSVFLEDEENGGGKYGLWKQLGPECKRILQMKVKG